MRCEPPHCVDGVIGAQETMDAKDRAFMGSQAAQEELKRRLAAAEERSHSQVSRQGEERRLHYPALERGAPSTSGNFRSVHVKRLCLEQR